MGVMHLFPCGFFLSSSSSSLSLYLYCAAAAAQVQISGFNRECLARNIVCVLGHLSPTILLCVWGGVKTRLCVPVLIFEAPQFHTPSWPVWM